MDGISIKSNQIFKITLSYCPIRKLSVFEREWIEKSIETGLIDLKNKSMPKTKTIFEVNTLNAEVNKFAEEMKDRLAEKAAEGKRDWETKTSEELFLMLDKKMYELRNPINREQSGTIEFVDIANLAMFCFIAKTEGR